MLEIYFQAKIIINPLFDENTLISHRGFIFEVGKWPEMGSFHLKFEKWDKFKHSWPLVLKGFGGWLRIKNLHLDSWCRKTFEVIRKHFGRLENIANETLNLTNCSEARIQVKENLCGFMHSI